MRRVFVIRKDLNLSPGKLAAMVGHCAEAFWTSLLKAHAKHAEKDGLLEYFDGAIQFPVEIDGDIWDNYVNDIFTKTICECKNKDALHKVDDVIRELDLKEGTDYGFINDCCLTELTPENPDGTTTIGMWFKPLPDDDAHKISKKFKLYGAFDCKKEQKTMRGWKVTCKDSDGNKHEVGIIASSADDAMKEAEKSLLEGKHARTTAFAVTTAESI